MLQETLAQLPAGIEVRFNRFPDVRGLQIDVQKKIGTQTFREARLISEMETELARFDILDQHLQVLIASVIDASKPMHDGGD